MFKGNKSGLPVKPCEACGRPMSWRKAWAKNWDAVKVCSERCRRSRRSPAGGGPASDAVGQTARGAAPAGRPGRVSR